MTNLVALYGLAEKLSITELCNKAIDALQDKYHKFGTVFGPGLPMEIIGQTMKDSNSVNSVWVAPLSTQVTLSSFSTSVYHPDRLDHECSRLRQRLRCIVLRCPITCQLFCSGLLGTS